ncbi:hypothetical protein [Streptomyces sp. NPDC056160]|uniref:hypothetical protein n=1 Tax=Streptomyces sp. NPDC056160 TaxID=3345731 RepID=UPI0035D7DE5B
MASPPHDDEHRPGTAPHPHHGRDHGGDGGRDHGGDGSGDGGGDGGGGLREGEPTCPVALARARAGAARGGAAPAVLERSLGDAARTGRRLEEVRDVLIVTGARATVEYGSDRLTAQVPQRSGNTPPLGFEGAARPRCPLLAAAGAPPDGDAAVRPRSAAGPCAGQCAGPCATRARRGAGAGR